MKPRRRWTLLVVGLAALATVVAAVSIWQLRLRQQEEEFERLASGIRAGMTPQEVDSLLGHDRSTFMHYSEVLLLSFGNGHTPTALSPNFAGSHWYCIYLKLVDDRSISNSNARPSQVVQVYRLPKPPKSYLPKTEIGLLHMGRKDERPPLRQDQGYIWDFYEFVTRRRREDPGIPYELIHSDLREPTYDTDLVTRCVNSLKSARVTLRREAAETLGEVGLYHHLAVPALISALDDDDEVVRTEARASLNLLDPGAAIPSRDAAKAP